MPVVSEEECTGCRSCVEVCPAEAIALVEGVARIDQGACTECGACVEECPVEAISETK